MGYLNENLTCLFYGLDVLSTKYALFASYQDLLADVAEAFGIWVALMILVVSALTVLVVVQQTTVFSWEAAKVDTNKVSTQSNLVTYRTFTKISAKNNTDL